MKLALLLPSLRGGGAERLSISLARSFLAFGHSVVFILMKEEGELLEEARMLCPIYSLETLRVRTVPSRLARVLEYTGVDFLIANIWPLTVGAAVTLRKIPKARRPILALVEHNQLSKQYSEWRLITRVMLRISLAIACRIADCRIAVSEGVAADVAGLAMMRGGLFKTIHNPVLYFAPTQSMLVRAEAIWGRRTGRRILSVGSLKRQKNHALLIRAFVRMRRPGDKLLILGEGHLRAELISLARDLGADDSILFPGFHQSPEAFYATADLFVLSSNYEGFGNVIVEALAAGLPVVSTDCPSGPAEILKQGVLGRLVKVGDANGLAAAIVMSLDACGDYDLRRARAHDFTPMRIAAAYIEALSRARDRTLGVK